MHGAGAFVPVAHIFFGDVEMDLPPVFQRWGLFHIALLDQVVDLIGGVGLGDAQTVGKFLYRGAVEQIDHVYRIGLGGAQAAVALPQDPEQAAVREQTEPVIAFEDTVKHRGELPSKKPIIGILYRIFGKSQLRKRHKNLDKRDDFYRET